MILERIGDSVAKAPAVVMVVILILTIVLGAFAWITGTLDADVTPNIENVAPEADCLPDKVSR